jgi:hypothetical protein
MSINAPSNTERIGIGRHLLTFEGGVAEDPGLNAGERARLMGLGFKFDAPKMTPAEVAYANADAIFERTIGPIEPPLNATELEHPE